MSLLLKEETVAEKMGRDERMIKNLSSILQIPEKIISIKATSNEKIGFIGDGLGIAAESIIQIRSE